MSVRTGQAQHVDLAEATGSLIAEAMARSWVSVFVHEDDPRESLSAAMESADLGRRAGHRWIEIQKLLDAAEGSLFLGEWGDTRAMTTELGKRELASEQRVDFDCIRAMLAALTGDPAAAAAFLERHINHFASSEWVAARTNYLTDRALTSLATGDMEGARRDSAEAVSADPTGINSPHALAIQARACLWLRDVEGALKALAGMRTFRGRWMAAARLTAEAGLAALEERAEEAAETYRGAIEAWRALDCTLDLVLCELDLVLLLGPDHPDATVAKEARDIFTQIGAKPFLERLNNAVGSED